MTAAVCFLSQSTSGAEFIVGAVEALHGRSLIVIVVAVRPFREDPCFATFAQQEMVRY